MSSPHVMFYGKPRYVEIPQALIDDLRVSSDELALYLLYAKYADKEDSCFPGNSGLMKRLNWGKEKFYQVKKALINHDWIYSSQGRSAKRPEKYRPSAHDRFSTCDVVIFWHPSLKVEFMRVFQCTEKQDSEGQDSGNPDTNYPQEKQTPKETIPTKNTHTTPPVCVDGGMLNPSQRSTIDIIVEEYRKTGKLQNEGALRATLKRRALAGELEGVKPQEGVSEKSNNQKCPTLEKIKEWERAAQKERGDKEKTDS